MTPEQEAHARGIGDEVRAILIAKYARGAKEHGGNLWEVPIMDMLDMAVEEAIDQCVYLITLRQKMSILLEGRK